MLLLKFPAVASAVLFSSIILGSPARADESEDAHSPVQAPKDSKVFSQHTVRVFPTGRSPAFEVVNKGKDRILKKHSVELLPTPFIKWIPAAESGSVPLSLGKLSPAFGVQLDSSQKLNIFDSKGQAYWSGTVSASPKNLIVLYQAEEDSTWAKPSGISFADDAKSFPDQALRVINVSPGIIEISVGGDDPIVLESGKHSIILAVDEEQQVTLHTKDSEGKKSRLLKLAHTKETSPVRTTVVVHTAKPRRASKPPVGVSTYTDSAK